MAQFKEGEYVTSKERPYLGKGRIIDEVDFNQYIVRFDDGDESLFEGSDLVAANACKARNYAYSTDPIKLMIQYAKKEDYGGITDFTNPGDAEDMGLYPADLVKRIYAKAMKYYAGGRNMATPAQQHELVGLISQLKYKAANACAKNGIRSTNAAVQDALNSACARNAAPPKTIDLSAGNWEATLMPRTDYLLLEKGDIRTKDYTALEGTVAEVTRKVYSSVKGVMGKDLADAKAIVAKANAEMVKYEKDERSHGRGTNSTVANALGAKRS